MSDLDDWQPIKTAPKNSDMVLIFGRYGRRVLIVSSFLTLAGWSNWPRGFPNPTHWRPMLSIPHESFDRE